MPANLFLFSFFCYWYGKMSFNILLEVFYLGMLEKEVHNGKRLLKLCKTSGTRNAEAVVRRRSVKRVFLEFWQRSKKNAFAGVLLRGDPSIGALLWILWNFKNSIITEHFRTTTSRNGPKQSALLNLCQSLVKFLVKCIFLTKHSKH